jgi:hypothetical protein
MHQTPYCISRFFKSSLNSSLSDFFYIKKFGRPILFSVSLFILSNARSLLQGVRLFLLNLLFYSKLHRPKM